MTRIRHCLRISPAPLVPVTWGEMDTFQHVNNIVYFRYFESERLAYFYKLDLIDLMTRTGIGPILASTSCRFKVESRSGACHFFS